MSAKTSKLNIQERKKDYGEEAAEKTKETLQGEKNSMEETKNYKQHVQRRSCSTGRVQKRAQQGHTHIKQGARKDKRLEQKAIPKKKRKNKIWKVIASSRKRNLSGEVAAGKK